MTQLATFILLTSVLEVSSACHSLTETRHPTVLPRIEATPRPDKKLTEAHANAAVPKSKKKAKEEPEEDSSVSELEAFNQQTRKVIETVTTKLKISRGASSSVTGMTPQGEICFVKVDTTAEFEGQEKLQVTVSEMHDGNELAAQFKVTTLASEKGCIPKTANALSTNGNRIRISQVDATCEAKSQHKFLDVEVLGGNDKSVTIVHPGEGGNIHKECKVAFDKIAF